MKMKVKRDKRGIFFTISIVFLILPLILLVVFYSNISKTKTMDVSGKVRCDELHYFVEDVRRDLERAMVIFGRRAAIYAISDVVTSGKGLDGYRFNCSANCMLDNCEELYFTGTGAEAAIAELMVCGTLHGETSPYMVNHTFPLWMDKLKDAGKDMHFTLNLTMKKLEVVPIDAWNFATISTFVIRIQDDAGICYYEDGFAVLQSNTSILDLEDPLYPLHTEGRVSKYIRNCTAGIDQDVVAGCSKSDLGNGTIEGTAFLYNNIGNIPDLINYCANTPQEILGQQILVLDLAGGIVCNGGAWKSCLNASHPKHFAGMIDYSSAAVCTGCPSTIPYICDTGEMDEEAPWGPGSRAPGCDEANISNGTCLCIRNIPECNIYQVIMGSNSEDLDTTCYQVSDVEENYNSFCIENYSNGPSFFDRLDGRLNLSSKYRDQAYRKFGNSLIGIESFVRPYTLEDHSITVNENATWVDYLYWQNESGCNAIGVCRGGGYEFKLDCSHAYKYRVDTECEGAHGCCGDGTCNVGEDYGNCPADCSCPAGCPAFINITHCKLHMAGPKYNVTYNATISNQSHNVMNLSINPIIYITNKTGAVTSTGSYVMDKAAGQTGIYEHKSGIYKQNVDINVTVYASEPGCPTISNSTNSGAVGLLPPC